MFMPTKNFFKILLLSFCFACVYLTDNYAAEKTPLETITYDISPLGSSVYNDYGVVELFGKQVNLVTFKTNVFGFSDLETIHSDLLTNLPVRVERDISFFLHDEHIEENYFPDVGKLIIEKFEGTK